MPKTCTGGCWCGAIRFDAKGPPVKPHTRSCRMGQSRIGARTLAWVEVPRDLGAWTGPGDVMGSGDLMGSGI